MSQIVHSGQNGQQDCVWTRGYHVNLSKSSTEIRTALTAVYGERALKKSAFSEWINRFKAGHSAVKDYNKKWVASNLRDGNQTKQNISCWKVR